MTVPATLVWLAPEPADAEQSRALSNWARAHGMSLVMPRDERPPPIAVDPGVANDVERALARARDAIAARDGDAVDKALDAAESNLRGHPELPQASWLMAEVERGRAMRWRRVPPLNLDAADHAWNTAEALDSGRVVGAGEEEARAHPAPASVSLELVPADAVVWLDGEHVHGSAADTRAGPHALVVESHGTIVWAAWIEAPAGHSTHRVVLPPAPVCSALDVGQAHLASDSIDAAAVRCPQWVAAAPGTGDGKVRVAMCESQSCGPILEWHAPTPWTWTPPVKPRESTWPTWATWGLVGTGAAIATGIVIVASGVLQSAPTETRFVNGGIKAQ